MRHFQQIVLAEKIQQGEVNLHGVWKVSENDHQFGQFGPTDRWFGLFSQEIVQRGQLTIVDVRQGQVDHPETVFELLDLSDAEDAVQGKENQRVLFGRKGEIVEKSEGRGGIVERRFDAKEKSDDAVARSSSTRFFQRFLLVRIGEEEIVEGKQIALAALDLLEIVVGQSFAPIDHRGKSAGLGHFPLQFFQLAMQILNERRDLDDHFDVLRLQGSIQHHLEETVARVPPDRRVIVIMLAELFDDLQFVALLAIMFARQLCQLFVRLHFEFTLQNDLFDQKPIEKQLIQFFQRILRVALRLNDTQGENILFVMASVAFQRVVQRIGSAQHSFELLLIVVGHRRLLIVFGENVDRINMLQGTNLWPQVFDEFIADDQQDAHLFHLVQKLQTFSWIGEVADGHGDALETFDGIPVDRSRFFLIFLQPDDHELLLGLFQVGELFVHFVLLRVDRGGRRRRRRRRRRLFLLAELRIGHSH